VIDRSAKAARELLLNDVSIFTRLFKLSEVNRLYLEEGRITLPAYRRGQDHTPDHHLTASSEGRMEGCAASSAAVPDNRRRRATISSDRHVPITNRLLCHLRRPSISTLLITVPLPRDQGLVEQIAAMLKKSITPVTTTAWIWTDCLRISVWSLTAWDDYKFLREQRRRVV